MVFSRLSGAAKTLFFLVVFLAINCTTVWAASEKLNLDTNVDPVATPMPTMFSLLVKLVVSLIIVGGLAYLTIRFLKRNTQINSGSENMVLLDQLALGMNRGVFVVDVASKVLVLGVTDHNVNLLYEVTDSEAIKEMREKAAELEAESIIPPRFWEILFAGRKPGNQQQPSFKSHIQEQVKKLQVVAERSNSNAYRKDDSNGQDER